MWVHSSLRDKARTITWFSVISRYLWHHILEKKERNHVQLFHGHLVCVCVCVCVCVYAQSSLTLCEPMDCSSSGSSVHGIFQARILQWVAISFSRITSQPMVRTQVSYFSCTGRWIFLPLHHLVISCDVKIQNHSDCNFPCSNQIYM